MVQQIEPNAPSGDCAWLRSTEYKHFRQDEVPGRRRFGGKHGGEQIMVMEEPYHHEPQDGLIDNDSSSADESENDEPLQPGDAAACCRATDLVTKNVQPQAHDVTQKTRDISH